MYATSAAASSAVLSSGWLTPSLKWVKIVLRTISRRVAAPPIHPYGGVLAASTSVGGSRAKITLPSASKCGVVPRAALVVPIV